MAAKYIEGIGRRKTSSARVRIVPGSGEFVVNGKSGPDYFTRQGDMDIILAPLRIVNMEGKLDV